MDLRGGGSEPFLERVARQPFPDLCLYLGLHGLRHDLAQDQEQLVMVTPSAVHLYPEGRKKVQEMLEVYLHNQRAVRTR